MNRFFKGVLCGVGIGLLIAPMRGEEMRRLVTQRAREFRGYLPENEQLSRYSSQVGDRVSHTADVLKDYAQHTASNVKQGSQKFGQQTRDTATTIQQDSQDVMDSTKDTIRTAKTNVKNSPQPPTSNY
ncbi:MAG TPA: YtxH domain-containing protein [Ktedonobacteraceae bacterium]|jgi:gas vesicle protein|nr:YtxH domain-containing protein [Ktedonobacteraceae bacterium]